MVKTIYREIKWSYSAEKGLKQIYDYLKQYSETSAEKIIKGISEAIDEIPKNPQRYGIDKFKKNNHSNYRAFEKFNYRIVFKFTSKEIFILRIRHVKQEPLEY